MDLDAPSSWRMDLAIPELMLAGSGGRRRCHCATQRKRRGYHRGARERKRQLLQRRAGERKRQLPPCRTAPGRRRDSGDEEMAAAMLGDGIEMKSEGEWRRG